MRNIKVSKIKAELKNLLIKANFHIPQDIIDAIKTAGKIERLPAAKMILEMIMENAEIAEKECLPLCQDCGTVYINLEIGPDICLQGQEDHGRENGNGNSLELYKALNDTVSEVYDKFYLRKSIVYEPVYDRKNTGDNGPAIINADFSCSKGLGIEVNLKGGGSENCSWLFMLNPSSGEEIIIQNILVLVKQNATRACPPIIIGVGIGSTASEVTKLARKAAFRNLNIRNADKRYAMLEGKILRKVNETGIGPGGLGGNTTALACNIEFAPCHIATLPLAVFFGCHSTRRANITI